MDISQKLKMDKKGQLDMLRQGVMTLVFIAVLAAAGAIALDEFQDDLTANSTAFNATDEGLIGIGNATDFLSTIGTLLGVSALVAVVIGAFMFVRR